MYAENQTVLADLARLYVTLLSKNEKKKDRADILLCTAGQEIRIQHREGEIFYDLCMPPGKAQSVHMIPKCVLSQKQRTHVPLLRIIKPAVS